MLLFKLSIDFPKEMLEKDEFKNAEIFDKAGIIQVPRFKKNLKKEPEEFFDYYQWGENAPKKEDLFNYWLV